MKEVARRAGVGMATVSRALSVARVSRQGHAPLGHRAPGAGPRPALVPPVERGRSPLSSVVHPFTPPAVRPDCQYRCRNRNATINGMIEMNDPVSTVEKSTSAPPPLDADACQLASPTVTG